MKRYGSDMKLKTLTLIMALALTAAFTVSPLLTGGAYASNNGDNNGGGPGNSGPGDKNSAGNGGGGVGNGPGASGGSSGAKK